MNSPNQQSDMYDETLASNATRLLFKTGENNRLPREIRSEGVEMDTEKSSVIPSYAGTADMVRRLINTEIFL